MWEDKIGVGKVIEEKPLNHQRNEEKCKKRNEEDTVLWENINKRSCPNKCTLKTYTVYIEYYSVKRKRTSVFVQLVYFKVKAYKMEMKYLNHEI